MYIHEDIQSRLSISKSKCNIKILSVAANLRTRKWFLNCSYKPHQNITLNHLKCLTRLIDKDINSFDNFIFIGDFNVSINHNSMIDFCDINGLKILLVFQHVIKNFIIQPALIYFWQTAQVTFSTVKYLKVWQSFFIYYNRIKTSFQKLEPKIIKWLQKLWHQ